MKRDQLDTQRQAESMAIAPDDFEPWWKESGHKLVWGLGQKESARKVWEALRPASDQSLDDPKTWEGIGDGVTAATPTEPPVFESQGGEFPGWCKHCDKHRSLHRKQDGSGKGQPEFCSNGKRDLDGLRERQAILDVLNSYRGWVIQFGTPEQITDSIVAALAAQRDPVDKGSEQNDR